jgi:hypothetical protein
MSVRNSSELGENLILITKRLMANQNLLKLLYYSDKDPLSHEDLSEEVIKEEIFEKLIRVTPKLPPQGDAKSRIGLRLVKGIPNEENGEFREIFFSIEIFVPMTQWIIKNTNLRPFAIMGELEKSLKGKRVNGLGTIQGEGFKVGFFSDEMTCYQVDFLITTYD